MTVKGIDGIVRDLDKALDYVAQDIEADLQDWGNETAGIARKIHKFGNPYSKGYRRTGNGDRSIKAEATGGRVRLYVDPDNVTVSSKKYGSFNYIWAQHDGTKRDGKIVIKADPFLERAIEKNKKKLQARILKTLSRIVG